MIRYLYEILFVLNIYKNDLKDMLLYNKRRDKMGSSYYIYDTENPDVKKFNFKQYVRDNKDIIYFRQREKYNKNEDFREHRKEQMRAYSSRRRAEIRESKKKSIVC